MNFKRHQSEKHEALHITSDSFLKLNATHITVTYSQIGVKLLYFLAYKRHSVTRLSKGASVFVSAERHRTRPSRNTSFFCSMTTVNVSGGFGLSGKRFVTLVSRWTTKRVCLLTSMVIHEKKHSVTQSTFNTDVQKTSYSMKQYLRSSFGQRSFQMDDPRINITVPRD